MIMNLLITILYFILNISRNYASKDWSYDGPNGPSHWCDISKSCCGNSQSPIDIVTKNVKEQALKFNMSRYDTPNTLVLENDGERVTLRLKDNSNPPKLASIHGECIFESMHFHWGGPDNSIGSEHTIDDQASRMELHLEHYEARPAFKSVNDALNSNIPGMVSVWAFLIKEKTDNDNENTNDPAKYDPIVSALSSVMYREQKTDVKDIKLVDLLHKNLADWSFYGYNGSFTSPPCNEGILRMVVKRNIFLSKDQISKFFNLFTTKEGEKPSKPMLNNFRPVQALNGRTVQYVPADNE